MCRRLVLTLEQVFRPGEPAAHGCHQGGVQEQVHRDANRCTCRRDNVASLYRQRVRALPRLDGHLEMAGRVSDLAEQRQIGRTQEPLRVRLHQERVAPSQSPRAAASRARWTLIARPRNRDGYGRIDVAHASGLRPTNPSQEES